LSILGLKRLMLQLKKTSPTNKCKWPMVFDPLINNPTAKCLTRPSATVGAVEAVVNAVVTVVVTVVVIAVEEETGAVMAILEKTRVSAPMVK